MSDMGFLGSGMRFPPRVNQGTGRFEVSAGERSVKESVYLILMTQLGERWLEPEFGSKLTSYAFGNTSVTDLAVMRRDIQSTLSTQEPRVKEVNVDLSPTQTDGKLIVDITYTVIGTNVRDNFVFPFYLNQNQGEEDENAL
jgi:phage baseplate assembly protein W